jgi:hypothetical protein
MKRLKAPVVAVLLTAFATSPLTMLAADAKGAKKPKPYPLTTCLVSDEKLGGDMGEPYVFVHDGREIKLCCKSCLKDFKKETSRFLKKVEEAEKKARS